MYSSSRIEVEELLRLELSLDPRDLRAHAWYHGSISRQHAEELLHYGGDFLVRDCTSSSAPGDFVLSCRWRNHNLHFLILKDVLQQDTIYEKLSYRFENENFDTVSDLITFHVGSGKPISEESGALISKPKTRTAPILKNRLNECFGLQSDYVSLMKAGIESILTVTEYQRPKKLSTLNRVTQKSLNLQPPPGLLEELNEIPQHIKARTDTSSPKIRKQGSFDPLSFESILIPTDCENIRLDRSIVQVITTGFLEASDRLVALHLTKIDWELLSGTTLVRDPLNQNNLYALFLHNSSHRWNNVIERSLTLSHFVILTILLSDTAELILDKWIRVAGELKTGLGNFFSFCSIMRGLLMPQITQSSGRISWIKLRTDFTASTFNFETIHRTAFQNLSKGVEPYPPNSTIPELFSSALILEDSLELLSVSCINTEENQLQFFSHHLNCTRSLIEWRDVQKRNMERNLLELDTLEFDIVLSEMFQTELHLALLWGTKYLTMSLKERCECLDRLF